MSNTISFKEHTKLCVDGIKALKKPTMINITPDFFSVTVNVCVRECVCVTPVFHDLILNRAAEDRTGS